jgi:hypothetical protein
MEESGFLILVSIRLLFSFFLKARLHYGNYRSKLVRFKEQKKIFALKKSLVYNDLRHRVNTA